MRLGESIEIIGTMEGYIGGIALPTNVTLGKCIPSMLCVVDVYLTTSMQWGTFSKNLNVTTFMFLCLVI